MRIRQISDRVQSLSDKINSEADRVASIKEKCDDYLAIVDSISLPYDGSFQQNISERRQAEEKLRKLSLSLLDIETDLREAAWIPDEIVDHLDSIAEATKSKGTRGAR